MKQTIDRFEYTTAHDRFFNYCLAEYTPVVPYESKFRSVNLLFQSFDLVGVDERLYELVRAIREQIGVSRTVWAVKQREGTLSWEFYFYDYRRNRRARSITRLLDIMRPFVCCEVRANEGLHYFMFSLDIDEKLISGGSNLEEIHMYIGNPGSTVSSGICYSVTSVGTRLENFYFFFDSKRHLDEVMAKVCCSVHVDLTVLGIDQIVLPQLRDCKTICVANKQENDCVYFSGINVDQLIFFLKTMGYDDGLVSFVEGNRSRLDHLQYDVGFDYRMEGKDLVILKSGYYGVF